MSGGCSEEGKAILILGDKTEESNFNLQRGLSQAGSKIS